MLWYGTNTNSFRWLVSFHSFHFLIYFGMVNYFFIISPICISDVPRVSSSALSLFFFLYNSNIIIWLGMLCWLLLPIYPRKLIIFNPPTPSIGIVISWHVLNDYFTKVTEIECAHLIKYFICSFRWAKFSGHNYIWGVHAKENKQVDGLNRNFRPVTNSNCCHLSRS